MKAILYTIAILMGTTVANAREGRERYKVTGRSGSINAMHYEIFECVAAQNDAFARAATRCLEEGYDEVHPKGWRLGRCKRRFAKPGHKRSLHFFCK